MTVYVPVGPDGEFGRMRIDGDIVQPLEWATPIRGLAALDATIEALMRARAAIEQQSEGCTCPEWTNGNTVRSGCPVHDPCPVRHPVDSERCIYGRGHSRSHATRFNL